MSAKTTTDSGDVEFTEIEQALDDVYHTNTPEQQTRPTLQLTVSEYHNINYIPLIPMRSIPSETMTPPSVSEYALTPCPSNISDGDSIPSINKNTVIPVSTGAHLEKNKCGPWRIIFYMILVPAIYIFVFMLSIYYTSNVYHFFSWLATLFSISYILCVIHAISFSKHLCHHSMTFTSMKGEIYNYIPDEITTQHDTPWHSISRMCHIRGSSNHKWHTILMGYGSYTVVIGAIIKLFDIETETSFRQMIGVYFVLSAGIGGLFIANFDVYSSPTSFNKCVGFGTIMHLFGCFCYAILGNAAFAVYNDFDLRCCYLFISTIIGLAVYQTNQFYQYKKNLNNPEKEDYHRWVHNMSVANVGLELLTIIPSVIGGCALVYQFGK